MHPIQIKELLFLGVVITAIVMISFLLKGKYKKIGWAFALFTFVAYCIFFVSRPYWIDSQIEKKVKLIKPYLIERYPGEKWTISTVNHRDSKQKQNSPYIISVTFKNESDVTYEYRVEGKDNIKQIGASTPNKLKEKWNFKHLHLGKP